MKDFIIEIGKEYYYQNRPIKIIKEFEKDLFLCWINFDISNEVEGQYFCTPCMIGGGAGSGSHVCDEYDEAIEALTDEIYDKETIFVPRKLIREQHYGYTENEKIKTEIINHNEMLSSIKSQITKFNKELTDISLEGETLIRAKQELEKAIIDLQEKQKTLITNCLNEEIEIKRLRESKTINAGSLKLSNSELLELLNAKITLNRLEHGGVDNWDYYGDALHGIDSELKEINDEALDELSSYLI